MSREVRRVPASWVHPKTDDGGYIPLFDGSFAESDKEWNEGYEKWQQGLCEDYSPGNKWKPISGEYSNMRFSDYHGARPSPDDYMPEWEEAELTHIMMYETCTEGTPISPAFTAPEDLAKWLADNGASSFGSMKATYDQWLTTAQRGWAPSAIMAGGEVKSGVEAL